LVDKKLLLIGLEYKLRDELENFEFYKGMHKRDLEDYPPLVGDNFDYVYGVHSHYLRMLVIEININLLKAEIEKLKSL
jgi:hypothetical protein